MAGVIDTNLLLFAANRDAQEHAKAQAFLTDQVHGGSGRWYLTEGIVYEFLRVSTHPKVFDRPLSWEEALAFLRPVLDSDQIAVLVAGHRHWEVLAELLPDLTHPSGNLFFDIRTWVLMREHGIRRIYTADTDFLGFPDIEVVNPLRSP